MFVEIFPWRFILRDFSIEVLKIFLRRFVHGEFSFGIWFWRFFLLKICLWRFFLEDLFWRLKFWKKFNEDLFMEIFPLEYGFGDFSFWRFVRGDFSLKIYSGDWTFEKILMKICSWRFFLKDLFLEIFPLKFWKFLLKICSLEIFPLEYGFGDFSFEKWRFFLWSQSEEDEDGLEMMKIY